MMMQRCLRGGVARPLRRPSGECPPGWAGAKREERLESNAPVQPGRHSGVELAANDDPLNLRTNVYFGEAGGPPTVSPPENENDPTP